MVAGSLRCLGTPQYLKNKFAQGHELNITTQQGDGLDTAQLVDQVTAFVTSSFAAAQIMEVQGNLATYQIPPQAMSLGQIFRFVSLKIPFLAFFVCVRGESAVTVR